MILERTLHIHERNHQNAAEAQNSEGASQALRLVNISLGQLELIRGIKSTAIHAHEARQLPFDRMIGALESSCIKLEADLNARQRSQHEAFVAALAGGSRPAYDHETNELNVAAGRFEEARDWLHRARALAEPLGD